MMKIIRECMLCKCKISSDCVETEETTTDTKIRRKKFHFSGKIGKRISDTPPTPPTPQPQPQPEESFFV
jgi:hypothetical protein